MKFKNPKNYNFSIKFLLILLISLLALYFLPRFIQGNFWVYVNVSEVPGGVNQAFSFSIRTFIELILMGPVFSIIYYILMKKMINKLDNTSKNNEIYKSLLEIAVVLFIIIYNMGHAIHILFNHANSIYTLSFGLISLHYLILFLILLPSESLKLLISFLTPLYLFLYYSDEWLGHHLIHYSFFAFFVIAVITELLQDDLQEMSWDEILICIILGIGASFVGGYATYEGQCAFPLFILSIILLIFQIFYAKMKKLEIRKYPIFLAILIYNIIVIAFFLSWIALFGMKTYYPFIYQPSEL